jgi:hypothetical protein
MRNLIVFGAFAAVMSALPASAVTVEAQMSSEFQKKLQKDYGEREAELLAADLTRKLERAFSGGAADKLVVVIEDAVPNRPTMGQLRKNPSLDAGLSFGVGGARISGVAFNASGAEIGRYEYDWYETDISLAYGLWTWSNANRAFDRFSHRFAKSMK